MIKLIIVLIILLNNTILLFMEYKDIYHYTIHYYIDNK